MNNKGKKTFSFRDSPTSGRVKKVLVGRPLFVKVELSKPLQLVENLKRAENVLGTSRYTSGSASTCVYYPETTKNCRAPLAPDDFIEPINDLNIPSIYEYAFYSKHFNSIPMVGVVDKPYLQKTFSRKNSQINRKALKIELQ